MGVWINTVTVTGKWGVAGGGGSRREKAEKRRVAERLELRVWEGEEFSLHQSGNKSRKRGKKKRTYLGLLCCSLLYANTSPIAWQGKGAVFGDIWGTECQLSDALGELGPGQGTGDVTYSMPSSALAAATATSWNTAPSHCPLLFSALLNFIPYKTPLGYTSR